MRSTTTIVVAAVITIFSNLTLLPRANAQSVTLHHIHGLAYSADGIKLLIPSHHGLAIFSNGKWRKAPGPEHDYMGLAVSRNSLYSSGHPAPGTPLKNPFGLLKSRDGGKSWEQLGLAGEADFHLMAVGYRTDTVYVFNSHPNSRMTRDGIYYSTDQGKTWRAAEAKGLPDGILALAAHPSDARIVAIATGKGLYLSRDSGSTVSGAGPAIQTTAVFFELDGDYVWFGGFDGRARLTRMSLKARDMQPVELPPMTEDAVSFIAQNRVRSTEWTIATFKRDIHQSADRGKTWKQIARQGMTLDQ